MRAAGQGVALKRLRKDYPDFVRDLHPGRPQLWTCHKDLRVQDDQIEAISGAVVEFWKDAPERVFDHEIGASPNWLEKATTQSPDQTGADAGA